MRRFLTFLCLALLPVAPASAHDYWLEPERFFLPAVGVESSGITPFHLYMGDGFKSEEERPLQLARTTRFALFVAGEETDLTIGLSDGQLPAFRFTPRRNGTHLFVMERTPQRLELAARQFNDYLREEGLTDVLRQRTSTRTDTQPGRERYTRYIKSLVQVGARHTDDYKRIAGQRLEIVPLRNPYQLKRGATLPVKILFDGQPLAGATVAAYNRTLQQPLTARTDSNGVARFKLTASGAWLVRLVYMRRCANCADADWESFWGACTFGVR